MMSVVHHPLGLDIDITATLAHKGINTCCNVGYDVSSTSRHSQGLDITVTLLRPWLTKASTLVSYDVSGT